MTKIKPSSPKLMSKVLEAVTSLGTTRGRGILRKEVIDFVKKNGKVGSRNLTVQVHQALKHGVNAGILKLSNNRYKPNYSVIAPFSLAQSNSKTTVEKIGKNNKNRGAKTIKIDEDEIKSINSEDSLEIDNQSGRNVMENDEILTESQYAARNNQMRIPKEKYPVSRESQKQSPGIDPPIEKSPIDTEKTKNQNFTSNKDKKEKIIRNKEAYRQDFVSRKKSRNCVAKKHRGVTSQKRALKNYVSFMCNKYTGSILAIPCMVLAEPWCKICLNFLKNYIDNCMEQNSKSFLANLLSQFGF